MKKKYDIWINEVERILEMEYKFNQDKINKVKFRYYYDLDYSPDEALEHFFSYS
jgi:hypothetical protein